MPRESKKAKAERAVEVCRRLDNKYGPVECFLDHTNHLCASLCADDGRPGKPRDARAVPSLSHA